MTLPYTLRLLCVLAVAAGLILALSQIALALAASTILRRLDNLPARWRERILYGLQIGPALLGVFVAAAVCLPAYLRGETNLAGESVSSLCLFVAGLTVVCFAVAIVRGLRNMLRTLRFASLCRRSGRLLTRAGAIPVLAIPDAGPPVCLIGFFRPLILVAAGFDGALPAAFDLALAHECSHAHHRDNWKLLTLSLLPRFDRLLPGGDPWSKPWQQAADWAADDDAVQGSPARSALLAEALVRAARAAHPAPASRASCICTALTTADAALALRIDRLLHPRASNRFSGSSLLLALAALALFVAATACTLSPWIYEFSERLLHLGAA